MRFVMLAVALVGCGGGVVGDGDGILEDSEVPEVGWFADLVGTAHDVAGRAVIVDEDTIEIQDFVYDGGGLNARMFLLVDGENFNRDIELTENLVGDEFAGETLTMTLPPEATFDDFNLLSFWCIPAGVSFGSGVFEAPEGS